LTRFDRPATLAPHLEANAETWGEILGVDATPLEIFGRVEALALGWAALQREVLTGFGINYAELATLGMLRTTQPEPRCSPSDLRALVGQSSAGMTRILDKLEAEGHLHRAYTNEHDRRRVDIVLDPSGAALAESALRALLAAESELLDGLGPVHRAAIARGADALIEGMAARRK
jgi:DNA-binding MarR family transcriptional regulator